MTFQSQDNFNIGGVTRHERLEAPFNISRGITLPLTLTGEIIGHVVDPYGNTKLGVSARGQIDRTAFGITWNAPLANGTLALAEKVTLTLEVQAAAQDAAA